MQRPTKIIVSLTIVFVGLFIFYLRRAGENDSRAVNYAGQIEQFRLQGVPEFRLPLFDAGKGVIEGNLALADVHSAVTLVNFWASWCEPCKAELPSLVELAKRYAYGPQGGRGAAPGTGSGSGAGSGAGAGGGDNAGAGALSRNAAPDHDRLTVLAVSLDKDLAALKAFLDRFGRGDMPVNFLILVDRDFSVPPKFGTKKVPETFVINREHKLIMKVIDQQNWLTPQFIAFLDEAMGAH